MKRKGLIYGIFLLALIIIFGIISNNVEAGVTEEVKLTASDGLPDDSFGFSVSIDGSTIVAGAKGDDNPGLVSGSAYVFEKNSSGWNQSEKLTASDAAAGANFGQSVSINEDTIVVGAWLASHSGDSTAGAAYVFNRFTGWSQQQKLTASDADSGDYFGQAVAINGNTIAVGAIGNSNDQGAAYIFEQSGTLWIEQAKLTASDSTAGDYFGYAIAIDGDYVVVGARYDDDGATDSGSAYVFYRSGTNWTQQAKLTASDAAASDELGVSVAIQGDIVVIGSYQPGGADGAAYVFERSDSTWSQQAKLTASDSFVNDKFGISVAIHGDYIMVGSRLDDDEGDDSGSAYLFKRNGTSWTEEAKLTASDGIGGEWFGWAVSIDQYAAVIGAYKDYSFTGSAYVFNISAPSVSEINDYIQNLPEVAFNKNPGQRKNALSNKLDAVMEMIEHCRYQEAIDKLLHDIRAKADGSLGGNPSNDWIVDTDAQTDLCDMIDDLIAYIHSLPPCTVYCSEVAANWCEAKGWIVVYNPPNAIGNIVCTIDGRASEENCSYCTEYNMLVWENGAPEHHCPGTYSTIAGQVYGGHIPCTCSDNLYYCSEWDMQGCVPDP